MKFNKYTVALLGLLGVAQAHAALLTRSDSTFGTFDASRSTRTLPILGNGTISDVNIRIDFAKCDDPAMGIGNTTCASNGEEFSGETFFYLVSPTGTRVDLIYTYAGTTQGVEQGSTRPDGTFLNNQNVGGRFVMKFDDQAVALVGPVMSSGDFIGEEALSLFNGENALGDWVLGMGDSTGFDPLSYFSATLDITTQEQVPEPTSLALLGIGLAGVGGLRRRQKA